MLHLVTPGPDKEMKRQKGRAYCEGQTHEFLKSNNIISFPLAGKITTCEAVIPTPPLTYQSKGKSIKNKKIILKKKERRGREIRVQGYKDFVPNHIYAL